MYCLFLNSLSCSLIYNVLAIFFLIWKYFRLKKTIIIYFWQKTVKDFPQNYDFLANSETFPLQAVKQTFYTSNHTKLKTRNIVKLKKKSNQSLDNPINLDPRLNKKTKRRT